MHPVNGRIGFLEPGESKDEVEGNLLCDAFNVEEEDGGKVDNPFVVDGVIGVSGIDMFVQPVTCTKPV